jgi:hypothetical protein
LKPETKFWHDIRKNFKKVKKLASSSQKLDEIFLYKGSDILELAACGLTLDACCSGLEACRLLLESLDA